ncbi:SurA N-terminal domain-containing protein [Pelagibacteraceae bacterium]|nr:SurA N-terminal domain-containing protein [Pelagibacteraceae bacterium]
MTTSIGKLSKSFFVKLLVGIIILPFVFWGMGDVFRGGNQNVIATIDSKKVNTQEFINYLNRLNLNEEQIKNLPKTDLIEQILSEYIGKKVMSLEIQDLGITINDTSLRKIIKNDKLFFKDDKFSRTEYEKFLLKSGISAPVFEANIVEQESRRQLLSYLSGGVMIPNSLVEIIFRKENQIKTIKYIDLEKFHSNKKPSQDKIKELYERNKKIFTEEFKSINYAEITPQALTGAKEYNEAFFRQLDVMENKVLDGQSFNEATKENNLKTISINKIDKNMQYKDKKKIKGLSNKLFKKFYLIKNEKTPEILKVDGEYFLTEIKSVEKNIKKIDNPEVLDAINAQLSFQFKIENNTSILKDISVGGFDEAKMTSFANDNNLEIKNYKLTDLKDNEIFTEGIIKRIFLTEDAKVDLVTNSTLTKNFLVLAVDTEYKILKKPSNEFEKYETKARLDLVNKIYKTFDDQLNQKYKVKLNQRTIERVKNSF